MNRLNFIGRGSAYSLEEDNTSAYIKKNGCLMLIDCGETVFKRIRTMNLLNDVSEIHILITHMHSDHIGSLAGLLGYCSYKYNIVSNVYFKECSSMKEYLTLLGMKEEEDYNLHNAENVTIDKLHLKFSATETVHTKSVNAYSYMIEFEEGNDIFYSGDTKNTNIDILPFLKKGNIAYHDTCLSLDEGCPHTSIKSLSERIPEEYRKQLYCMHVDGHEVVESAEKLGFNVVQVIE